MRKFLPLAIAGLIGLFFLALIVSGVVLLGYGVSSLVSKNRGTEPAPPKAQQNPQHPKQPPNLATARSGFATNLLPVNLPHGKRLETRPLGAEIVDYPSNNAKLAAYISEDRAPKGERLPAVVFAHSGFSGISMETWEEIDAFRKNPNFVVMCPSFRGENSNPGRFEMFYGEVDDLLNAVSYLRSRNSVDPKRIYVVGVGSGGTLALLASAFGDSNSSSVRAYFAVGGCPDLGECLRDPGNFGKIDNQRPPFDPEKLEEMRLRSAVHFVKSIHQPTIFFQRAFDAKQPSVEAMREQALQQQPPLPFQVIPVRGAAGALELIHNQIAADKDLSRPFQFQPNLVKPREQ